MHLLERDGILDELRRLQDRARAGHGSLVLIGGEAGASKSAVLQSFAAEVGREAPVLRGLCDALSTPRPLGPLLDIAAAELSLRRLLQEDAPPRPPLSRRVEPARLWRQRRSAGDRGRPLGR